MLDSMQEAGIDVSGVIIVPEQATGFSVILNRGTDRAILTYAGLIPSLTEDRVSDEILSQARHLHVASYFLQTDLQLGLPELFRRAHDYNLTVSLDTNWDPSGEWRGFESLLPLVDVFLPNENEALALTNQANEEAALEKLARLCPTVAVKLGARGAIARQNDKVVQTKALKINVVDAVCAGDTFDSGFLFGYLNGWTLEQCLELASVCGSLSTREAGGTKAQPILEEALEYVDK
jgi:sugar/nucleoside kinase (ribokinase family)